MANPTGVDVAEAIDRHKVGGFQIRVLLLCALVVFMDGFDTQALGYVAPTLRKAWDITPAALAPVLSASLFGLMLGALIFSPIADRIGRKRMIVACVLFFGVCTLATVLADSLNTLLVIRFITGLGLGGAMPNAIALTSEYAPKRGRATMIMVMFCGFSLGAALGGLLAAQLLADYGWKSVFYVGGIVPILMVPVLMGALPESIRLMALKGGQDIQVGALLRRINPALVFPAGTRFTMREESRHGLPMKHLFAEGRTVATLLLWVMFFMNLLDLYFLASWLPTVIHDSGLSVETAVVVSSLLQIGGTVGTLSLGWFIDRFGPYRVLTLAYLFAGVFIAAIGFLGGNGVTTLMVTVFGAGFCVVGAQIGVNAFAANFYPTFIRATGVGYALGIGRIGSIIGPLLGGVMLQQNWHLPSIFLAGAAPALCAAIAMTLLGLRNRPSNPDQTPAFATGDRND